MHAVRLVAYASGVLFALGVAAYWSVPHHHWIASSYFVLLLLLAMSKRGASATSISPCRRHPMLPSQVRADATRTTAEDAAMIPCQPSNHRADEHGSSPTAPGRCLRILFEHVHERVSHLPRIFQDVCVVAAMPYGTTPMQRAVDCARQADYEALHTAHEPRRRIGLHHQVQMIGLDREVQNAEGVS